MIELILDEGIKHFYRAIEGIDPDECEILEGPLSELEIEVKGGKQVIDFLVRNAVDAKTSRPFTPDILESAIKESGVRIDNQPIEKQVKKFDAEVVLVHETKKLTKLSKFPFAFSP